MGGPSSFAPTPPPDKVLDCIKRFFSSKDKKTQQIYLNDAYNEHLRRKPENHFVYRILSAGGLELKNGLGGIEIESKLTVSSLSNLPHPINKAESLGELERELLSWKLTPKNQDKFLKDEYAEVDTGVNTYFGTDERESFVVIKNEHGWYLKIKDTMSNYVGEQSNGQRILRRKENLVKVNIGSDDNNILSLVDLIMGACQPMIVSKLGDFRKEKATQFVLEKNSGRTYSLVLSKCSTRGRSDLLQLEIEYVGHIPGFVKVGGVESEKNINEDISYMSGFFQDRYGLVPTTLTKFQWLTGKEEFVHQKEDQTANVKGQSFFGKSV
ncbi:hypothetical protein HYX15_00105 [Candidatus Woesearchaeota archaeon]|nr:hypothetical protein [Candidatus Woesearchaeota archaeon]